MVFKLVDNIWGEATGRNEARRAAEKQREFAREQFEAERQLQRSIGQEAQSKYQQAMRQFGGVTSGTPESVSRLQQLIRDRALPEQQRAMSQGRIARQQQGVRGIDAAVLEQQQANALQRQLAQDAENVALQQQLKDREMKQKLAADQATAAFVKSFQRNI
jgi:hypothetical protein